MVVSGNIELLNKDIIVDLEVVRRLNAEKNQLIKYRSCDPSYKLYKLEDKQNDILKFTLTKNRHYLMKNMQSQS